MSDQNIEYKHEIGKTKLDTLLKPMNNFVLVKELQSNRVTTGGIIVPESYLKESHHAVRFSEVVAVPDKIYTYKDRKTMTAYPGAPSFSEWSCDVDIQKGDVIVHDYLDSMNSWVYVYKGENHRLIPYTGIYAYKRIINGEEKIIALNGFVILEEVYKTHRFLSYENKEVIPTQGIVRYVGKPNKKYIAKGRYDFDDELKDGDRVVLIGAAKKQRIYLEEDMHSVFFPNKKYFRVHRYQIGAVLNN